jgi:hypothetical protein
MTKYPWDSGRAEPTQRDPHTPLNPPPVGESSADQARSNTTRLYSLTMIAIANHDGELIHHSWQLVRQSHSIHATAIHHNTEPVRPTDGSQGIEPFL